MTKDIKLSDKQSEALALCATEANRIMMYGGSRSGKTFLIVLIFILTALWFKDTRQAILRHHRTDAKQSLWMDTIRKVLKLLKLVEGRDYVKNESDMVLTFNGTDSEVWVGGLDDKVRVDKILGNEYCRIYFNESSQLSYDTITTALTRLAQKIDGLELMAFFDMNPPSPLHWTYTLFIQKKDPETKELLKNPNKYAAIKINPADNEENLPENYIEDILENLPERKRKRFRDGDFVKEEGVIYSKFDATKHVIYDASEIPTMEFYSKGLDFGLNMAAVLIGYCGDMVYILDCYGAYNVTTSVFQSILTARGWDSRGRVTYCDPAGGERIKEVKGGKKATNDVEAGIDSIETLIEQDRFRVWHLCRGVLDEIDEYKRDEEGKIIKENDHFMDGMRYGHFSFRKPANYKRSKQKQKPITKGYRKKRF